MLFNSLHFIVFFPVVVVLYFLMSPKWRTILLLLASYYFYMSWKPAYALLIFGSTLLDFTLAKAIYRQEIQHKRKQLLLVSILLNIGVLFVFKYLNFFSENILSFFDFTTLSADEPFIELLLPVGISFYTFQTLSYTIDVYRKDLAPERNFARFALFVSFFPQLVAGPIERATHLLPQFKKTIVFEYKRVVSGLRLILWGFFKKIVIADQLAQLVDQVYDNPAGQNGVTYLIASYFFAFQIYCDFSGYSDIAIGSARILGFDLMANFKQPYLSKSIKEFWSRWHISLSTWFRDYVYIPLGGNRRIKWRWYYNLFVTFLISGIWHGANWTFVFWGAFHGVLLILGIWIARYINPARTYLGKALRITFIFQLITIGWVFFRSSDISSSFTILTEIASTPYTIRDFLMGDSIFNGFGPYSLMHITYLIALISLLYLVDWSSTKQRIKQYYQTHSMVRMMSYFILFYWILFGGYFGETTFIYFQF